MDPQAFELLMSKVEKIEKKVDSLWDFRMWLVGAASAAGTVTGLVSSLILHWISK